MRSIDRDPEGVYNAREGLERKNGGAGRLSSGQTDNKNQRYQKVESLTSYLVFLSPACVNVQQETERPEARKEVVYRGKAQRLGLLEATGSRPVCSTTKGSLDE